MSGQAMAAVGADEPALSFDTTFLRARAGEKMDVSRFEKGNTVSPGTYKVDIWVNTERRIRDDVRFVAADAGSSAYPCFTRKMLEELGVDFAKVDAALGADKAAADDKGACMAVGQHVPGATVDFDFGEQRLDLSIAQKFMRRSARGYVSPDRWDYGVNAAFMNYSANSYVSHFDGQDTSQSHYLGLNGGVNLNGWRLRNQGSLTNSTHAGTRYDNIATYVQHDVQALGAQATLGDSFTSGEIFDTVSFRGAQLATDDRMLPDSQRGYAPIVRGTAQTNARVTIRQNGQVIYETSVSPGPFEINDLYPTGYGGNLDVTVTEADGRKNSFVVPYAAVPQSLRPGISRFSATAGRLRNDALRDAPEFGQATFQRGLSNSITAYGGAIGSQGYTALNAGAALNSEYGAVAIDVTAANTQIPGAQSWNGTSWRASYNKFLASSNTNVALAAYRYSTPNYLGFSDAAMVRDLAKYGGDIDALARQRDRLQLVLNQNFGSYGSVFLTASSQQYWNRDKADVFYQAGYSNAFRWGSFSITAGRTRDGIGRVSDQVGVNFTIPLGHSAYAPMMTSSVSKYGDTTSAQTSISGTVGEERRLSYNAYGSYGKNNGESTGNGGVSGTYTGNLGQMTASASSGARTSQVSAGVSGAIVAHPGGVTLSQTVGNTFGIVHAPGAEGASVSSASGVEVDSRGYAVVPYMQPYSLNLVSIDPKGSSTNVEFESTSEQAVPRAGAVPMVQFQTVTGRAALIQAPQVNGEALPFGADVLDANGRNVGVVAQDSRIFVRGVDDKGALIVKWGDRASEQCRVDYRLPKAEEGATSYVSVQAGCVAGMTAQMPGDKSAKATADAIVQ
ncbi:fimbria/pilus outer membrane usher protein [Variovorax dokdonensis]